MIYDRGMRNLTTPSRHFFVCFKNGNIKYITSSVLSMLNLFYIRCNKPLVMMCLFFFHIPFFFFFFSKGIQLPNVKIYLTQSLMKGLFFCNLVSELHLLPYSVYLYIRFSEGSKPSLLRF